MIILSVRVFDTLEELLLILQYKQGGSSKREKQNCIHELFVVQYVPPASNLQTLSFSPHSELFMISTKRQCFTLVIAYFHANVSGIATAERTDENVSVLL